MSTQFCYAKVDLFDGLAFHIDGNSKITWDNGTYAAPKPNALSLPNISTCPGSTERCRASCYVNKLKVTAPDVYKLYELNEMTLHNVLLSSDRKTRSAVMLADWIVQNASGGFRWHVSGDIISFRHADWIRLVAWQAPHVPFWIYTRTLDAVPTLDAPNLAVNISADKHNINRALAVSKVYGGRICYLVSAPDETIPELPKDSVIFPDYPLRGRELPEPTEHPWWGGLDQETRRQVCPADFFGQSESARCGPCHRCLYPIDAQKKD